MLVIHGRHSPLSSRSHQATEIVPAYRWRPELGAYVAEALEVLTLEDGRVKAMTAFMLPELVPRFGLPEKLPAG